VVKCGRCGHRALVSPVTRSVKPVPEALSTHLELEWTKSTSPYATACRYALREERRRAYRASTGGDDEFGKSASGGGIGIPIPAWWFFWLEGLDEDADINRVVFLPENMPPRALEV